MLNAVDVTQYEPMVQKFLRKIDDMYKEDYAQELRIEVMNALREYDPRYGYSEPYFVSARLHSCWVNLIRGYGGKGRRYPLGRKEFHLDDSFHIEEDHMANLECNDDAGQSSHNDWSEIVITLGTSRLSVEDEVCGEQVVSLFRKRLAKKFAKAEEVVRRLLEGDSISEVSRRTGYEYFALREELRKTAEKVFSKPARTR